MVEGKVVEAYGAVGEASGRSGSYQIWLAPCRRTTPHSSSSELRACRNLSLSLDIAA